MIANETLAPTSTATSAAYPPTPAAARTRPGPTRSWKGYLLMVRERLWLLVLIAVPIAGLAANRTFSKTPLYTAEATVEIWRGSAAVLAQDALGRDIRSAEDLNTQVRVLESLPILERVAQRLTGEDLRRFLAPYEVPGAPPPSLLNLLFQNRTVSARRMTLVLSVSYSHPDPEIAALVANLFADELLAYKSTVRNEESLRSVEELKKRADAQRRKVQTIELQLQEYRESNDVVSLDETRDIVTERLVQLSEQVNAAGHRLAEVEVLLGLVRRARDEGSPLTGIGAIANLPLVGTLAQQLAAQQITRDELAKRYRARHPRLIEATEAIAQTRSELDKAVASAVAAMESDFENARHSLEQARLEFSEQEKEAFRLDRLAVSFDNLRRELLVNEQLLQVLLSRIQDMTTSASIETQNARIMDRATPPEEPSSPKHATALTLGIAAGLGLGLGAVVLGILLDDRVKGPDDLEQGLGLPVVAVVPRVRGMDAAARAAVVATRRNPAAAESFLSLHAALRFQPETAPPRTIVVTGAQPGDGASFVASNLALAFAANGERTLLVDANLRNPAVQRYLNIPVERGTTEPSTGSEGRIAAQVVSSGHERLDVLPAGGSGLDPSAVLAGAGFAGLMQAARASYDRIVVDAAALGAVSDTLLLQGQVDACLFVARYNHTRRQSADTALNRWFDGPTPMIGAVLNDLPPFAARLHHAHHLDTSYLKQGRTAAATA